MRTHHAIKSLLVLFAALAVVSLPARTLADMNVYFGNLHSHTKYSDGSGTPQEAFYWARYSAKVDFYAVTDHGEQVDPYEWWKTGQYANAANQDGAFVAIRGFEWSHPWWGHITVWNTSSYTNAVLDYTMAHFYKWLDQNNGIAQFNHPGREYGVFEWFAPDSRVLDNLVGGETANRKSSNNADPDAYFAWYLLALDQGWKIAPTFGQDNHSLSFPNGGRTAILAGDLTRAELVNAIRAKRLYSTDDPNLRIYFSSGDQWMGSTITIPQYTTSVRFNVKVWDDEPITKLELISTGGTVLAVKTFYPNTIGWVTWYPRVYMVDSIVYPPYVFLRVTAEDTNSDMPGQPTNVAYSAPIWIQYQ
jgi:hypothetical protein